MHCTIQSFPISTRALGTIDVYKRQKLSEKYPTLKTFAKLQEGNTAFQNELDDKAIAAYTEVINELEAKRCV